MIDAVSMQTLSRPSCQASTQLEAELEARIAVLALAGDGHRGGHLEEVGDVDAHQRRRHDPEHRERRVAAADLGLAREDGPEAALVREPVEVGAGVGDRRELRAAAAGPLPEVLEVGARLDRRARLRGGEEERLLEVDGALEPPDRLGVGRVEDVERLDVERPPQHLRRERGAAHARAARSRGTARSRPPRRRSARRGGRGRAGRRRASRASDPRPSRSRARRRRPRSARRSERHAAASSARLARIPSSSSWNESANFWTPSCSSVSTTSS